MQSCYIRDLSDIYLYLLSLWSAVLTGNFYPQYHLTNAEAQAIMSTFLATGRIKDQLNAHWVAFLDFTCTFSQHLIDRILLAFLHVDARVTGNCILLAENIDRKRRGIFGAENFCLKQWLCAKYCRCLITQVSYFSYHKPRPEKNRFRQRWRPLAVQLKVQRPCTSAIAPSPVTEVQKDSALMTETSSPVSRMENIYVHICYCTNLQSVGNAASAFYFQ